MNFDLTKEQRDIQKAAREFAEGEFDREMAMEYDRSHKYPRELLKKAAELGFVGIYYPQEYGGQGFGRLEHALVVEEFCRKDSGLGICMTNSDFGSDLILKCGSEDQKRKYLIPITRGALISAGAFTEPDHGSDITRVSTTAVKEKKEFVINGTKTFITNGAISDFTITLCQTESEAHPSYRGMSTIIVESNRAGYEATELGDKMGMRMSSTAEISYKDVRVPIENLIGVENRGFYQLMEFLDVSRILVAAQSLGIAQGAFDRALAYSKKREQFGTKLAGFQVIQHMLADMAIKIETARLLTYKAAWTVDQGKQNSTLTSMAKTYSARIAVEVADDAIQIHGGYGYMLENEVERFYRDARVAEIYEGTREIQKNIIARQIIGKI